MGAGVIIRDPPQSILIPELKSQNVQTIQNKQWETELFEMEEV